MEVYAENLYIKIQEKQKYRDYIVSRRSSSVTRMHNQSVILSVTQLCDVTIARDLKFEQKYSDLES